MGCPMPDFCGHLNEGPFAVPEGATPMTLHPLGVKSLESLNGEVLCSVRFLGS